MLSVQAKPTQAKGRVQVKFGYAYASQFMLLLGPSEIPFFALSTCTQTVYAFQFASTGNTKASQANRKKYHADIFVVCALL